MPATLPQVNFFANPFGSITRGVMATIYTLWVMVGVRQGGLLVFCPPIVPKLVPIYQHNIPLDRILRAGRAVIDVVDADDSAQPSNTSQ